MRIGEHPILGKDKEAASVRISIDGRDVLAKKGEMIAAALLANGVRVFRRTEKTHECRAYFCGIGQCTDCMMEVDGVPGIRTCITPVREGMRVRTQEGVGEWRRGSHEND